MGSLGRGSRERGLSGPMRMGVSEEETERALTLTETTRTRANGKRERQGRSCDTDEEAAVTAAPGIRLSLGSAAFSVPGPTAAAIF